LTTHLSAQASRSLSYQAVIRNGSNVLVSSGTVGLRVSILPGSETADPVYVETHRCISNVNGLVTFELGEGSPVSGSFEDIAWSAGTHFLKTESDPGGGTEFSTLVGTIPIILAPSARESMHYVGQYLGGGIVFYVEDGGKHGLITATIDHSMWRDGSYSRAYTVRDGVATDKFNAKRMLALRGAEAYEESLFPSQQGHKLSDWYLPTRYELDLLYLNRHILGGYSAFVRGWKSTEVSRVNAWFGSFRTGASFTNGKDDVAYIRVLRSF
jgi:hypothetical protein